MSPLCLSLSLTLHMTSSFSQSGCRSVAQLVTVCPPSLQWCYVCHKCKPILTLISTGFGPWDRLSLARSRRHTHTCIHTYKHEFFKLFLCDILYYLTMLIATFYFFLSDKVLKEKKHSHTDTHMHIHSHSTYLQHDTVFCSNGFCRKQNRARHAHT